MGCGGTSHPGVSAVAAGAGAHGLAVPHCTNGVFTTHTPKESHTGVHTLEEVASLVDATVAVRGTVALSALCQRVANEAMDTGTHRLLHTIPVGADLTVGVLSTWAGLTEVSVGERSAVFEGVTGVSLRAGTDGLVFHHLAVCPRAAGTSAWVGTLQIVTGLVIGAFIVVEALSKAPCIRISLVIFWA